MLTFQKANRIIKDYQISIAKDAEKFFPDSCISGGFRGTWYEYPYSKVGFKSVDYLSWQNFELDYDSDSDRESIDYYNRSKRHKTEFHWFDDWDDYKLSEFID